MPLQLSPLPAVIDAKADLSQVIEHLRTLQGALQATQEQLETFLYPWSEDTYEFIWNPGSIAAGGYLVSSAQTTTVGGLGSHCLISCGTDLAGLLCFANFTAALTYEVTLLNPTAGAIDLAESTFKVKVIDL